MLIFALLFQLKLRIDFFFSLFFSYDWERNVRVKEVGRFEFPTSIDMRPYLDDPAKMPNDDGLECLLVLFHQIHSTSLLCNMSVAQRDFIQAFAIA